MELFKSWLNTVDQFRQSKQNHLIQTRSLESRQTGSCGGMSSTELKIRIDLILDDFKTPIPVIEYTMELAGLSHIMQARILSELADLSELSNQHACEFLSVSSSALKEVEETQYEQWLFDIKQLICDGHKRAASELINSHHNYIDNNKSNTVYLCNIVDTLEKLVFSIHKSELPISVANDHVNTISHTNGYQLFLPARISTFDCYDDNYRLYKALTFHLLGQLHCETQHALDALNTGIKKHGQDYIKLFSKIETLRIDKYLKIEFPGVWRDIECLNHKTGIDYPYQLFAELEHATADHSIDLSNQLIGKSFPLP